MNTATETERRQVEEIFYKAPFIAELGVKLSDLGPGWCETTIEVERKHLQQDGFIHAGVQATLADHTAGGAAGTLCQAGESVLSIEFKINFLRPANGTKLRCRGQVLRAGRQITVSEAEVFAFDGREEKLVSKATVTLAIVKFG